MPEMHLQRTDDTLTVTFGEKSTSLPLADVALNATTWERIYEDAAAYGKDLFEKTFRDEALRTMLADLPANERLLLVAEDPLVAAIPWEYLRDQNNKLLASRLNFVRGLPEARRRGDFSFVDPLEILAIPVSPVDEPRVLNVEREWKNLVESITLDTSPKSLILKRVRPPTRTQLERSLGRRCTSIIHFMGHSTSHDEKALLAFEDARGRSHLVDASDFGDSLNAQVFLVVPNSCLSAIVATTEFGNIAHSLVHRGFPYALGMQFILPDQAALVLSQALYEFLLQGNSVEDAVTHTRRSLEEPGKLPNPSWLAGIPVLYTSLRTPAPPLELTAGQPTIQPDPERLQKTCDLTALPPAEHFVGRARELSEVLDALLAPGARGFVLLHGLGGIGKTALARAVAERVGWHYHDRVLAISFETFASVDTENNLTVHDPFVDRFFNRLARFYELDPAQYLSPIDLQQAILQRRTHLRSLLVLDNIETLVDAQRRDHPTAKSLASFISRLKEGDGAILLTSRIVPPADWGDCEGVSLSGLSDEAGADLFLALLPADREHLAPPPARLALSHRVQGHPLSIRLLAGSFAELTLDLPTFLKQIETELEEAEQATPSSLEDPDRQKTLYACMDYSIKRLTPAQRKVLDAVMLFQAPFPPEFAAHVLQDQEQTPVHLQNLARLGLLTISIKTFKEGELLLLELHPMLRWYLQHHLSEQDPTVQERYGEVFEQLARQASQLKGGYDQSSLMRYLVRQSLPDFEAALQYLPPAGRSALAYHLAEPYQRLGQNRRALSLYEQALELSQELGNLRTLAVTQGSMANVLMQLGKPQQALALYEQSLRISQELGDVRDVSVTQNAMAEVLRQLGQPQEAITLYKQALDIRQKLGDNREVAAIRGMLANVLWQVGQPQEALALYEQALRTMQELGDVLNVTAIQNGMAKVLWQVGKLHEALALYEQALQAQQELGVVREVATTQYGMAGVLRQLGRLQEALALYTEALQTKRELGDRREIAITQNVMADILVELGKVEEAIDLYEQNLCAARELGDMQGVAVTQNNFSRLLLQLGEHRQALEMAWEAYTSVSQSGFTYDTQVLQQLLISIKWQKLGPSQFDAIWAQIMRQPQPDWLRDVQANMPKKSGPRSPEQLRIIVANTITVMTEIPEKRDEWRGAMTNALQQVQRLNQSQDTEFFSAILAVLDGQSTVLPEEHPYAAALNEIQAGIAAGGPGSEGGPVGVSREVMQAVDNFVTAKDWEATRQVMEAQQALLFQPEVEAVFEQNIAQAKSKGDERWAQRLEMHLAVLRECKANGIAATFERIAQAQEEDDSDELPFDTELITRSIAALLGSPQEKMSHMQYLATQANETTDEDLKALLATIQLALFSQDLSQHGRDLKGVYREAWEAIVTSVEAGGVDSRLFETIVSNTLAVLGPAASRRSDWRNNLVEVRNQATVRGNRNLVGLLDAVIGLVDAGGIPTGLGEGLSGVYARTWQEIVRRLPT
jgi:tetratricopeptide (TPR) repeat protein